MDEPIRVLLADDHPLVRAGIRATLGAEEGVVLVGEATDGRETERLCEELRPHVLLLDLKMPSSRAVHTVACLREDYPDIKVVVLTAYDDDAYVRGLVAAGAVGYVLKDEAPETVVRAIRAVVQGDTWFSRSIVRKLTQMGGKQIKVPALSEREREILDLVAQGWSNARIGSKLGLATQTVRNYLYGIYPRLGVASRAEAIIWARERGMGRL